MLPRLNLPSIKLRVRQIPGTQQLEVWDTLRRAFLRLTPEEWVRQHLISFLTKECGVAPQLINCEYPINLNGQPQRADIVVINPSGGVRILVECKAPMVELNSSAVAQVSRYNSVVAAENILLSNGLTHRLLSYKDGEYTPCPLTKLMTSK